MTNTFLIQLLQNTAILLAFAMLYEYIWVKKENSKNIKRKVLTGLFFSVIGIVIMFTPWTWGPGISFDTRSVMLAVSGLFFGLIPTIIIMIVTGLLRLFIGGDGLWMGLAVIFSSGTIGILWGKYRPNWKTKNQYVELLALGLTVHITMALCTILLPADKIFSTLSAIALPLILIYSPATMILGIIMKRQQLNWENRYAQTKLEESKHNSRQLLEGGNIVSLILNTDGSIQYCNDFLLKITGYSRDELIGKHWITTFIPSEIQEQVMDVFLASLETNNIRNNFENTILTKGGQPLFISWYNSPILSEADEVTGIESIGIDITNRKNYEDRLKEKNDEINAQNRNYKKVNKKLKKAKELAEQSERLKSAFLANMSHEIRTPMNGILGFTDLLKEPDHTEGEKIEFIQIIEKSGLRLLNIINDIIDISKIEVGLMHVNLTNSNINSQIEDVYSFFKYEAERKGITFSFNTFFPAAKANILTDRDKLFGILTNLVRNAFKFTDNGSIEFGYTAKDNELVFYVKDTGIGIAKEKQEEIFERFVQADIEDKMARQGVGLGLAISKAYIELLGGKIWVVSDEGKGSEFYFTLPISQDTKYQEKPTKTKSDLGSIEEIKDLKILIAEDDETSEMLLEIELSKYSCEIFKARTGLEAVEMMSKHKDIDLVLMDIQMPVLNGYDATKKIRTFNSKVIIIAQTAYGLLGDREKAIEAGCNDHIAKPINRNALKEILQSFFN